MYGHRALLLTALGGCQVVFPLDEQDTTECFADRFDDTTLRNPPWIGNAVTIENETLVLAPPSAMLAGGAFDLDGASIELEIVELPASVSLSFVAQNATTSAQLTIASDDKLSAIARMNGMQVDSSIVMYSSTAMRFLRLRDAADGVTFETSADGDNYTTRGTSSIHLGKTMGVNVTTNGGSSVAIDNIIVRAFDCTDRQPL